MPTPTSSPTPVRYRDLQGSYASLVCDLTRGRYTGSSPCHLDPDLDVATLPRHPDWRGSLGQVADAQSHLENNGIKSGDLFIFWGLFQPVEHRGRWAFIGKPEHRMFGWLQVDEIMHLGPDGSHALRHWPWLDMHPHVRPGWNHKKKNTLYMASKALHIGDRLTDFAGYGIFKRGLCLTASQASGRRKVSTWTVPRWLNPRQNGVGMTYHGDLDRWGTDTVETVARGQEFIADIAGCSAALEWLYNIFSDEHQQIPSRGSGFAALRRKFW